MTGCLNSVSGGLDTGQGSSTSEKSEIAEIYTAALEGYNEGVRAWERGISAFDSSDYSTAVTLTGDAIEQFEAAQESFTEAEEMALTIAEDDVAEMCQEAAERAGLMVEAARAGQNAARAAADGEDADTINEHVKTSQERREEASQLQVRNTDVVESALGI